MKQNPEIDATIRSTPSANYHEVTWRGEVIDKRRSAHSYAYAICRMVRRTGAPTRVVVQRWSNSARANGESFAVAVRRIP